MRRDLEVLLVNQYYPPDTSATATVFRDLVETLAARGHRVTVLCGRPSYDPAAARPGVPREGGPESAVTVRRVRSTTFHRRGMAGRVANYLSFVLIAGLRVLVERRPDVVVVGSDPPFAVWVALAAARGRPVVYSLRDLHPDFAVASGMVRPGLLTGIWDALHRGGLRRCALVVCLGETMAERVAAKGVGRNRIAVVPDGAWHPAGRPQPDVVAELRRGAQFVVSHAGNLGGAAVWECLAAAGRSMNGEASFLFVGGGCRAEVVRRAGLRLVPYRPPEELPSVMAAGDLQAVAMRRGMEGLVVPSKLYTILAHGRPVLAAVPEGSEVARIVREWGCGLVVDPEDPVQIAAGVRWARAHPEVLSMMASRALAAAAHFERGRHLLRLASLVEAAAGARSDEVAVLPERPRRESHVLLAGKARAGDGRGLVHREPPRGGAGEGGREGAGGRRPLERKDREPGRPPR